MSNLPETILEGTDWLLLSGNNLGSLNKAPDYLENITLLNLSSSKITEIDAKTTAVMIKYVRHLDIRRNNLRDLPQTMKTTNVTNELYISENPYECNCDNLWMKDWLTNASYVIDRDNVTCSNGNLKGT